MSSRGQVLVLTCALIGVLCAAALGIAVLGQGTHRRIRLQQQADGAAYAMAVHEARAFNLYAFANRTQASHYVSAMLWQSTLSFTFFTEAFMTDVLGVLMTLQSAISECGQSANVLIQPFCAMLSVVPGVSALRSGLETLTEVVKAATRAYQQRLRWPDVDRLIGREIIPAHQALNAALAATSTRMMLSTLAEVGGQAPSFMARSESGDRSYRIDAETSAFNACLFDRAHARAANGSPLRPNLRPDLALDPRRLEEDDPTARAKRTMAGIANATRYGCDADRGGSCPAAFNTSRTPARLLEGLGLGTTLEALLRPGFKKWGQTRLLTHSMTVDEQDSTDGNRIRHSLEAPNRPQGMLAQGDNLGADDLYWLGLPLGLSTPFSCGPNRKPEECWGDPRNGGGPAPDKLPLRGMLEASVWALNPQEDGGRGGLHWRVQYPSWPVPAGDRMPSGPYGDLGIHRARPCLVPLGKVCLLRIDVYVANVRAVRDGNHPWAGISAFSHFEPGKYAADCPKEGEPSRHEPASSGDAFNQPSAWVRLEREVPPLLPGIPSLKIGWGRSKPVPLALRSSFLAVARAQTYYHRPGNWREAPNFFNPYWRARLASVDDAGSAPPWLSLDGRAVLSREVAR